MFIFGEETRLLKIFYAIRNSDKYVNRYSCLSLLRVDAELVPSKQSGAVTYYDKQPVPGLKALVTDVMQVLDEYNAIEQSKRSTRLLGLGEGYNSDMDVEEELMHDQDTIQHIGNHSLKTTQLVRGIFEKSHRRAMSVVDHKLSVLLSAEDIMEELYTHLVACAIKYRVTDAQAKADLSVRLCMQDIYNHPYLHTDQAEAEAADVATKLATHSFLGRVGLADRYFVRKELATSHFGHFFFEYRFIGGMLCVLLVWSAMEAISTIHYHAIKNRQDPALSVFSSAANVVLLLFLWGLVCHCLRKLGIDYLGILEVPPHSSASLTSQTHSWIAQSKELEKSILKGCIDMSTAFLLSFILYSRSCFILGQNSFVSHLFPTLLLFYVFYRLLFPIAHRTHWLAILSTVMLAPFAKVQFREGFVGDILTSIVRVIAPLSMGIIYIIHASLSFLIAGQLPSDESLWWHDHSLVHSILVPLISLGPLWIRFMQCLRRSVDTSERWPHFGNALKYASALVVSGVGIFRPAVRTSPLWVLSFIGATIFQFVWDITMDWGLLVSSNPSPTSSLLATLFPFKLRSIRLCGSENMYLAIAVMNLVLRFAWSLTLLPEALIADDRLANTFLAHIEPVVASIEIFRRMLWAVLRVEWEHLERDGIGASLHVEEESEELVKMDVRASSSSLAGRHLQLPSWASPSRLLESVMFAMAVPVVLVLVILTIG